LITSRSIVLRIRNVPDENLEKNQNSLLYSVTFSELLAFVRKCGRILPSRAGHRWQYGAWAMYTA